MSADVAVVIPTRNRAALLTQALTSVGAQRDVAMEVLVVDDGSSDGTADLVSSWSDPRVRLLRHERPQGVAAARNAGAAAASSTWVAFLDDDDLWAPDKLARQLAAAADDRAWVYAGAVEIDAAGRLLGGAPPPAPEDLLAGLRRRNLMPAGSSNVVVRTDAFQLLGGFDTALRHLADWDLWLRLATTPPAVVHAPLVAYRVHVAQATMDTTGMLTEALLLHRRHGIDVAAIHRWQAWSHLRAGRRRAALAAYGAAIRRGNVSSLARAAVALLHPRPTSAAVPRGRRREAERWSAQATQWLEGLNA